LTSKCGPRVKCDFRRHEMRLIIHRKICIGMQPTSFVDMTRDWQLHSTIFLVCTLSPPVFTYDRKIRKKISCLEIFLSAPPSPHIDPPSHPPPSHLWTTLDLWTTRFAPPKIFLQLKCPSCRIIQTPML